MFTGQYPDLHGVTQTDGIGKSYDDTRMRWLRPGEVPTLGNWFRAAGYDTHYDGKWHISHADLTDPDAFLRARMIRQELRLLDRMVVLAEHQSHTDWPKGQSWN